VLADLLPGGQFGQQLVDPDAALGGALVVLRRHSMLDEPPEDVAHTALASLVTPEAGDDAAIHDAAHARHLPQHLGAHDVAGRRAHDGHHLPRLHRLGGDVRIDGDADSFL